MTSKLDRSELSRALAKAIAYHDCNKPEKAALWAARLARLLNAKVILNDRFVTAEPEC